MDVRLHIARVSTKDVWGIKELWEVIWKEVDAREMSETMKVHDNGNSSWRKLHSGEASGRDW